MKSTKKDFEFFKTCCWEYIKKYQLNNWTFLFYISDKKRKSDAGSEIQGASVVRNLENLQAEVYFDAEYKYEDKEEIRKSAKHEIIHCLIGELYLLGIARAMTYNEIGKAEEQLTHKLEEFLI